MAADNSLSVDAENANFGDPAPGNAKKKLKVDYILHGVAGSVTANEFDKITLGPVARSGKERSPPRRRPCLRATQRHGIACPMQRQDRPAGLRSANMDFSARRWTNTPPTCSPTPISTTWQCVSARSLGSEPARATPRLGEVLSRPRGTIPHRRGQYVAMGGKRHSPATHGRIDCRPQGMPHCGRIAGGPLRRRRGGLLVHASGPRPRRGGGRGQPRCQRPARRLGQMVSAARGYLNGRQSSQDLGHGPELLCGHGPHAGLLCPRRQA